MNLVKWLRKNNRKVMTFVVIFCMVSFVVGSFGLQMIVGIFTNAQQTVGTFDNGKKIKSAEFNQADTELQLLQMLRADLFLAQGNQGLAGPILTYLLFPGSQLTTDLPEQLLQAAMQGQIGLEQNDIEAFFNQPPERAEILWILLKKEAYRAGCILSTETARMTLDQMTGGQGTADVLLNQVVTKTNMTEEQILRVFADLLGTLIYSNMTLNNQSVSLNQVKAAIGRSQEKINADFVEIPAEWFIDDEAAVSDTQIKEQFESYKDMHPGIVTSENPYGFGYMIPKRVSLDYIILSMDDVKKQIIRPTMDECEKYYDDNISRFQRQVPSDPNNPDSEKITVTRSYPEVATTVRRQLETQKTTTLANQIFNDIRSTLESKFETINIDEATTEQLHKAAGNYQNLKAISDKYNVPIHSGDTGWLTRESMAQDDILSSLNMQHGQQYLRLVDLAFEVTKEKSKERRIGMPSIRVWENIGSLNGSFYLDQTKQFVQVMAMVRVTDIVDGHVPETVDLSYETKSVALKDDNIEVSVFSLKDTVKDDVLLLDAMKKSKKRSEELAQDIKATDWDTAIEEYNKKYGPADPNNPSDNEHAIVLDSIKEQIRIPRSEIKKAQDIMAQNPSRAAYIQNAIANYLLTDELYGLLQDDQTTTGTIQEVIPFEPNGAYVVVKSVTCIPATMDDYLSAKAQTALQLNAAESQPIVLSLLSPDNIKIRMNYKPKKQETSAEPAANDSDESATDEETAD